MTSIGSTSYILPTFLWVCGLVSLVLSIYLRDIGPLAMLTAISTHSRIPSPLGQLPPFWDVTTNMICVYSWLLSPLVLLLWWFVDRRVYWLCCSIFLFFRFLRNRNIVSDMEEQFLESGTLTRDWFRTFPPLMRLPFPANIHPFLLNLWGNKDFHTPCGVHIQHVEYQSSVLHGRQPYIDIWRSERTPEGGGVKRPVFFFIHGMWNQLSYLPCRPH